MAGNFNFGVPSTDDRHMRRRNKTNPDLMEEITRSVRTTSLEPHVMVLYASCQAKA
jgi:hypothetical protein